MSEAVLTLLRWCLLALVYLFFFRVLQATWFSATTARKPQRSPDRSVKASGGRKRPSRARREGSMPALAIVEPATSAGARFELGTPVSIGRAAGCEITLDDTFVSQVHARVSRTANGVVVEDLGSTNGTYLNRKRVTAPVVMQAGDVIQVGSTVMELQ